MPLPTTTHLDAAPAVIAWDECACLLCGNTEYTPLLESADSVSNARFLIVRCKRCGLCFTNPRPEVFSMSPFYPHDYRCHQNKPYKKQKPDPLAVLLKPCGQAKLLDFGCGAGTFLERMQALGWHVTGLDASDAAVTHLRARGLTAHVGTLPQPHWANACFDAITMWQSLEHTHQPLDVLHEAHRLLTPDGMLLVAVPNFDGWASRYFGADWYGLDVPRHLTHFTSTTLTGMLKQAGFTQIELRQESHHSWIRHSAARQIGMAARFLRTRIGSGFAGWWGKVHGCAEGLLAMGRK
jgi:SAM-dependent methyltransferase